MPSTINASASAGLITTADTSTILQLQTGGTTAVTVDASQNVTLAGTLTATGVTTVPAGTAAAPAITTTGDTNTGIFFPAADTIAFSEGGTEAMRLNSAGNLGLGVTPSAWISVYKGLQVNEAFFGSQTNAQVAHMMTNTFVNSSGDFKYLDTNYASRYRQFNGQHEWFNAPSGTAGNTISFTQAMTLDASGNLGVGETSPALTLDVERTTTNGFSGTGYRVARFHCPTAVNADRPGIILGYDSAGAGIIAADTQVTGQPIAFWTYNGSAWAERARITSGGDLLVGTTSASGVAGIGFKFLPQATYSRTNQVGSTTSDSDTTHEVYSTGVSAYRFYVGYGGTIFATSIVITAISDERLKENVRDIDTGLNAIMALKPRRFDWKEGKGQDKKDVAGFIAQEFENVFPECVSTSKAGADGIEYKNINHETLIPTLVKAIQEQQALITTLTDRITALEGTTP
jgi:hypothetical protein